jgi:para-nitrobenzyl esterase
VAVVRTEHGLVEGSEHEGLHRFQGVPVAAPPFGALRFRAPQPPEPWDGVRDATRPAVAMPQPAGGDPFGGLFTVSATGEDSLTADIWTPDPGGAGLPVMVHIHGGSFASGAGSLPGYTGETFARDGIVHVGVNYRLGVDGYLHLPDGADNRGLRDQAFALDWVRRNVAAFGGDPARVTVYGQSAGGVSVMALLGLPSARGMFARAIPMSGSSIRSVDEDEALAFTRDVAKRLGRAPTAAALADVPLDRTIAAGQAAATRFLLRVLRGDPRPLFVTPFRMVHGTATLPEPALELARRVRDVGLLTGTNRNETAGFIAGLGDKRGARALVERGLRRAIRIDDALARAYREGGRAITEPGRLVEAAWTDWSYRIPTIRLLEAWQGPRWAYEFRWESPRLPAGLGAFHGLEQPFVRDRLAAFTATEAGRGVLGEHPPQELADAMHRAWVRFAVEGDPGWDRYEPGGRRTMVFDARSEPVDDPQQLERIAWSGRR